jgi:sterol desaturase/sphingolipid hydroxylase (fatty acid hydroxylase superfamily)
MPLATGRSSCRPLLAIASVLGPVLFRATPAAVHQVLAKPNAVSLIAVLVLSDLFNHLAHRLLHRVGWLWRLHAIHHSSEHLDWLATSRGHPIDQMVNLTAASLPVIALGGDGYAPALIAFLYLYPFVLHANARLKYRWLGFVFVTPVFHHWHHADEGRGARLQLRRHSLHLGPLVGDCRERSALSRRLRHR